MFLSSPAAALLLLPWAALWALGGLWLSSAAFRLRPGEQIIIGLTLGWLVQNWLANLLAWVLPVPAAFWAAAIVVFAAGLGCGLRSGWRSLYRFPASPYPMLVMGLLVLVSFSIGRGMAIFDDFAHLPTVSLMAAGDIPPHFPLDPQVVYGYHHFLLLFQAQLIRLGGISPWAALDAGRALAFGTAVMLSVLFAQRVTRSALAGVAAGVVMAFGSGTRWLLLLLPAGLVSRLGSNVQLIGSGLGSGPTLGEALQNAWAVEGAGPAPLPFAFANGIYPAGVIAAHNANGLLPFANILLLLLTFSRWRGEQRWRSWLAAILTGILLSIWGLLGEAELIAILAGWGLVALAWAAAHRTFHLPVTLWRWLGIVAVGGAIAFLEGGAWTDLLFRTVQRLTTGTAPASYQTIGFELAQPAVVSSHLGPLALFNPSQLVIALFELGPVLLALPLLAVFGVKAFRLNRWPEAALAASAFFALLLLCTQFTGSTGVRNTPRLYFFMPLCVVFFVPLFWLWARRRTERIRLLVTGVGLVLVAGGVVMGGLQLPAIQRPVYSSSLTALDGRMASAHWNRLVEGALVFDPNPNRAPTLFGRFTDSSLTWYAVKPEWEALVQSPDPARLQQAGFRYLYLDNTFWDSLPVAAQQALSAPCAVVLDQVEDGQGNFRRLIEVQGCR